MRDEFLLKLCTAYWTSFSIVTGSYWLDIGATGSGWLVGKAIAYARSTISSFLAWSPSYDNPKIIYDSAAWEKADDFYASIGS